LLSLSPRCVRRHWARVGATARVLPTCRYPRLPSLRPRRTLMKTPVNLRYLASNGQNKAALQLPAAKDLDHRLPLVYTRPVRLHCLLALQGSLLSKPESMLSKHLFQFLISKPISPRDVMGPIHHHTAPLAHRQRRDEKQRICKKPSTAPWEPL
jgi:hypothetical protein